MKISSVLLLSLYLWAIALPISAQPPLTTTSTARDEGMLVHLDTTNTLPKGTFGGQLGIRTFGGDENATYLNFGIRRGFAERGEFILRGGVAQKKSFDLPGAEIRHGGSDIELAAKFRFPDPATSPSRYAVAALIGIALPSTPAQSEIVPTLGIAGSAALGRQVTLFINPRAILLDDNAVYGLGIGAQVRLSDNVSIVGDVTPILRGDNTRRTANGAATQETVYGVALRWTRTGGDSAFALDLGYANGTGISTGFALTPGLGGSGSFYAALSFRR